MSDFPVTEWIWVDGEVVPWKDATLHVMSHVVHYGSGVFEGARCYDTPKGPACFRLDTHLRRLYDSAKIYRMAYDLDLPGLCEAVLDTIRANGYTACYIRPLLYRGYHELGVNPFKCPLDAAILVWEWPTYLGEDALEEGVDASLRCAPTAVRRLRGDARAPVGRRVACLCGSALLPRALSNTHNTCGHEKSTGMQA